ncbi:MAG: Xaa-Pro aminopeptidase [Candidatus Dasytiphilus stammeri]
MLRIEDFIYRRNKFLAKIKPSSMALIFAAPKVMRNNGNEYPYRQNSDFLYLTGLSYSESLLILLKKDSLKNHSILFLPETNKTMEVWVGQKLDLHEFSKKLAIDYALPWSELNNKLYLLLNKVNILYHAKGIYHFADQILFSALEKLKIILGKNLPDYQQIIDWRPLVHEMRLIKSPNEQAILRQAGRISALSHCKVIQKCRPGMQEYHLEGEMLYQFNRQGARFPAYNPIVGSGKNTCILHYTDNDQILYEGDLVLIDAGCELCGYATDITRTFPVNGKFSTPQYAIYKIVLAAIYKTLKLLRPGITLREVEKEVIYIMVSGLLKLGLMEGDINKLIYKKVYRKFFMHKLGHFLGLDVHDVAINGVDNDLIKLQSGMVLAIEPGLYISPSLNNLNNKYLGIGIRLEDNILITDTGNENLTSLVPKSTEQIEIMMSSLSN